MRIWTIGHSTRTIDVFISLLEEHGIRLLADVRSQPGSKRYPQFNKEALANSLGKSGINYEHFPELGGRRKAQPESKNTAWRNASFRGYADHMETDEFCKGIRRFLDLAADAGPTAIMCAEAVWWRCHRALIADYLKAHGIEIRHIMDANKTEQHPYTSAARIVNGALSYAESFLQSFPVSLERFLANGVDTTAPRVIAKLEARGLDKVWLHVDLDVLDQSVMPAVDSPGSLGFDYLQLTELVGALCASGRIAGANFTIYNPDRDPTRFMRVRQSGAANGVGMCAFSRTK